ncbi:MULTISPECIES: ATP-binding protein [unclassified Eubacterium (in: firmicutes)]|uniref:tRNA 2-thiocytidine biosynthesis TtcA family protein n=1 Tax=unclassified Eubacterium (in: firmicutes) TaxID=2624479 RepID=UPI000337D158|nr:ATP-binding protein [Eubacterium sp. LMAG:50]CDA28206.1 pP-loop family protein [Eubacterium sp. CAG:156]
MKSQKLYSYVRKAVDDFGMIEDGDKIAIGISGGKDSLTLLYALSGLKIFYPNKFQLVAITVDLGFGIQDLDKIKDYCKKFDVEYDVIETQIADVVFEQRKESNPCSLCAKMRKGALNNKAEELGCNKIAYAHHKDDIIETMFLSLIYEGRFHCFSPVTYLDKKRLTVIRPLMYVPEMDVIGFAKRYELPVAKNRCPVDGHTKREYVKKLVRQLVKENPGCKERFFTAIMNGCYNMDK